MQKDHDFINEKRESRELVGSFGQEDRSNAWYAIVDTLDEVCPDWLANGVSARKAACATIRMLKENQTK